MNKVILIGRLARDPELRYTQAGTAWARMTIAVNKRLGKNADPQQPTADFINLVAWDKLAEICGNNLKKGRQISVEGRIQTRSYDAQDGTKRYITEVVINEMEFLEPKGQGATGMQEEETDRGFGASPASEEDIPF